MSSSKSRPALFWFPLAALLNGFSMTALLVIMGFSGHHEIAASIGLVQGAALATFYVFSANARNLILADGGELVANRMLQVRLVLLLPLVWIAYFLSVTLGAVAPSLALVLILRRAVEWIGEIGLSQQERLDHRGIALCAVLAETFGFFLCLILSLGFGEDFASSAIPWALAPLISVSRARLSLNTSELFKIHSVLRHVGSTAIIGISVYIFRISVVVLVGKAGAGELFTAFAIGGIIPTIFGQILAPTLLWRFGSSIMQSRLMVVLIIAMLAFGGGVAMLAIGSVGANFNHALWLAIGLSIAGGAIMIVAALLRANIIHSYGEDKDVFGPDLLSNILLVLSIPFVYFTFGAKFMASLYLLSACLNLIYVWGAVRRKHVDSTYLHIVFFALGILLVIPVFFQLQGGLFDNPSIFFNTGGRFSDLPIPLSVFALFGGIAILGRYEVAKRSLTFVFFTMILYMVSVLRADGDATQMGGKFVLVSQFLFPMFGMVLGEMFGVNKSEPIFERAALWALLFILPAQLAATWISGHMQARPLVFIFSIYQHIQYFPTIVAALATMASFAFWGKLESMRVAIGAMIPIVLLHLVVSGSIKAIIAGVIGIAASCIFYWYSKQSRWRLLFVAGMGILVAVIYALQTSTDNSVISPHFRLDVTESAVSNSPTSATDRSSQFEKFRIFSDGIIESPETFVFGHATRPDRNLYPNAQNYWLDAMYSFGVLGIIPFLILLGMLSRSIWQMRGQILQDPLILGTSIATIYLVLIESMFNIGMRQIYPGIITFFILGLLSARLKRGEA